MEYDDGGWQQQRIKAPGEDEVHNNFTFSQFDYNNLASILL